MPPKGSKKLNEKRKQIGQLSSKKKVVSTLEKTLSDLDRKINTLQHRLARKRKRLDDLNEALTAIDGNDTKKKIPELVPIITKNAAKRRKKNPTQEGLKEKSKQRRRNETFIAAKAIHGFTKENPFAALDGMLDTMACKYPVSVVSNRINSKSILKRTLEENFHKNFIKSYYLSEKNKLRSLNFYYGHNVSGKRKYISQRKSNKCSDVANFIPYNDLAKVINNIDIGIVHNVIPTLTQNLPSDEIAEGMFRDLRSYVLRLVEFYLKVDKQRVDKLKTFETFIKKDPNSLLFLMCIGGDEAPLSGTSFLLSFLNVRKRIASSFENFLIFGANVKENSVVVRRYLKLLMQDVQYLESQVFLITVSGEIFKVEFKLHGLPNDMKMLAFLAGELSNSSTYFTTFANVSKHDAVDVKKKFSLNGTTSWKPFNYNKRLKDASLASKKSIELQKKTVTEATRRSLLTNYISTQLKSRQEKIPLVGEYINLARCEPLHLKNNCTKELFMKVLNITIAEAKLFYFTTFLLQGY